MCQAEAPSAGTSTRSLYGLGRATFAQPLFKVVRTADMLAADEYLRKASSGRHGAQRAIRKVLAQDQLLKPDSGRVQCLFGAHALRAAIC